MTRATQLLAGTALSTAAVAGVWTAGASAAFLGITGLWYHPQVPTTDYLWGWWRYLPYAAQNTTVALGLVLSAAVVGAPLLGLSALAVRWRWRAIGGMRGLSQRLGLGQIRRATSNNHGRADWMSDSMIERLFPSRPDPEIGGIVVGERTRDDLTPAHELPFDPEDPETLGEQGKGPLMYDHCKRSTTHSIIIGGGGAYKSTTLTTTLLNWKPSAVILDPAGELYEKLAPALEAQGKTVIKLDLHTPGPNVLEAIDLSSWKGRRIADTRLRNLVSRVIGPMPKDDSGNAGRFKRWGRAFVLALLADLVRRDDVPSELKTLSTMRTALMLPDDRLRDVLHGIYEHSPSRLAREMAAGVMSQPLETWGGSVGNARDDTEWIATYADLVSGDAFAMRDIVRGQHAIFVQVPQEVLQVTPSVARVVIGGLLDAVYAARARVKGRVGFFLDEAVLLGPEEGLKLARDMGRKSKMTLQLYYQSEGQIEDVWGKAQKDAWFDGVSFRSYTRIQNVNTAKDLVTTLGTYGVKAESRSNSAGSSARPLEWATRQHGDSAQESEMARDLMKPHELLQEMRANERITIVANNRPVRHLSAIDFLRPEIKRLLGATDYMKRFSDADLDREDEEREPEWAT